MATAKKKTKKSPKVIAKTDVSQQSVEVETTDLKIVKLVALNKWFGLIYLIQAVVLLFLSASRTLPAQAQYVANDALAAADANHGVVSVAIRNLFDVNISYLVVTFLVIAATTHLCVAYISTKQYAEGIRQGINRFRWLMFASGGSLALATVAMLSGVYSISTILLIVSSFAIASFLAWIVEAHGRVSESLAHMAHRLAIVAALAPLVVIAYALFGAQVYGDARVSVWVYLTFGVAVVFVAAMLTALYLQHRAKGTWADVTTVERMYLVGIIFGNSALAWAIFASALRS